jgi:hypothetical protein
MDCAAVKPKMEALVRGTLPDAERVLAEQHIGTCEGCRLELELVRAIGSQEKPAAVGQADWTLDRIFGAERQEGGPSQAAPAPGSGPAPSGHSGSAPTADLFGEEPSAGDTMDKAQGPSAGAAPDTQSNADGDPMNQGPSSWAFEPADAKADRKPPEESLFFAQEALARRKGGGKKGSNLRVMLWGTGGVVGAILLAISSWVMLHMAPSDSDKPPAPSEANEDPGAAAPGETPAEQAPEQPVAPAPAPAPSPTTQEVPAPSAPPPGTVSSDRTGVGAGAAAPYVREQRTSASSVPQPLPLPRPGITASRAPEPVATKHAPAPPPRQAAAAQQPAPRVAEPSKASKPSAPSPSASASGASSESEEPNAGSAEDSPPEPDTPAENPSRASEKERAVGRRVPATSWLAPGSNDSARLRSGTTPPPNKAPVAPEQSEPALPKTVTPIDRIHLATVAAEEEEDLVALRRLRATWKTFMSKMGVGPDRARARREYADCLWAIQSLTGKRSDQKDALAAYREYLLSAPAGGADSRSVSRLRQLEDAISERR